MNAQPQPGYFDGLNGRLLAAVPPEARNVVEFGCANGLLGEAFKRNHPATRWTGVDVSGAAVAEARRRLDSVVEMDLDEPDRALLEGGYDVVVFGDVLEHLRDPESFLRLARAISAANARLVCCLPNMGHASVIERMLAGDISYDSMGLLDRTHLRFLSPASSFKMLLDAGWLPNLRDSYGIGHGVQPFVEHLLAAAKEIGIPRDTCARNISLYQLIVECVKSPQADSEASTAPISVVVPVNRPSQFELNVARSPGLGEIGAEIIAVQGAENAAHALTTGVGGATKRWILYCHQDVYFPQGSGRLLSGILGSIREEEARHALIGFAGLGIDRRNRVSKSGLVVDRTSLFDYPEAEQAVSMDEFAIVIGKDSVHQIDPSLGWHAWATDLCLAARRGQRAAHLRIARVPVFHNSLNDARLPPAFDASVQALFGKYPDLDAVETLNGSFIRRAA